MRRQDSRRLNPGALQPERFLGDPRVVEQLRELRAKHQDKRFSDIIDAEGHQYVDLVMEGGGTLGIALVGYVYALESVGLRFLSIAGTSAGSITALLLAAIDRDKSEEKSDRLVEMLSALDLASLMDGDRRALRFIEAMRKRYEPDRGTPLSRLGARVRGIGLGFLRVRRALLASPSLLRHQGLNPGEAFLEWVHENLKAEGVETATKLDARVKQLPRRSLALRGEPGQPPRPFKPLEGKSFRLALISAEVSTGTKVDFPRTAELFWKRPAEVSPAYFVRASMSVPFFFYPLHLRDLPRGNTQRWEELVGYDGELGPGCTLVDGGIMSNFPISEFHVRGIPRAPTFGVKLGLEKRRLQEIGAEPEPARPRGWERLLGKYRARPLGQLASAIFNSARHTLDYDFIYKNPDYRQLVTYIDTGEHHWLDFQLNPEAQVDLFLRGVKAGADFLRRFDWEEYKEVRGKLAEAAEAAPRPAAARGDGGEELPLIPSPAPEHRPSAPSS